MATLDLPCGTVFYTDQHADASLNIPLVFVHGAGGSHLDWPPEMRRLPDVRIITLDLPGHGHSTGNGRRDTLAYARDVESVLAALGIDHAIIVGHSMGGAIAQQLAIHAPERVAGLVLLGTGSKLPVAPDLPERIVTDQEEVAQWITQEAWSTGAPPELRQLGFERLLSTDTGVLQGDYVACQAFDARPYLSQILVPVLVVGATDDNMVKLKFSTYLAEQIPDARLVIVENAGHMFPLEQPRVVASAITDWLAEISWSRD